MSTDFENEEKRKLLSERLMKREQDRLANQENLRSERLDKIVNEETLETFKPKFSEFKNNINSHIQILDGLSKEEKSIEIEALLNEVQNLQLFLSEATKYLTTFHIEKFSEEITILRNGIDSKYLDQQKQKKFNFKQIRKKTADNSKAKPIPINKPSKICNVLSKFGSDKTILISNLNGVTQTHASSINQMEIVISNLTNCTLYLQGNPSTVHIDNLTNSSIFIGPVSGSVFVNSVSNCKISVACHQLRIHKTMATDFYIYVATKAIIEDCKGVKFGRYNFKYDNFDSDFDASLLNKDLKNWDKIDDFNWLVADVPSPNWSIIKEE